MPSPTASKHASPAADPSAFESANPRIHQSTNPLFQDSTTPTFHHSAPPMNPTEPETVWAFALGKASIGDAPRRRFGAERAVQQRSRFLHECSTLIRAELAENKKGAAKAPYGSHRSHLTAEAARLFPTYLGRSTGFDPHSS